MLDLLRFEEITPAQRRALAAKLDRLSVRFAYVVIAATVLLFAFQGVRYAARVWALS
ncbi:MAG: hypothetical protein HC843_09425 [Sphingomonadales bacterium]|nr:hypothetical protein [Sphingomonadales bacterium]